jgi:hypothetical protein
MWAGYMRKNLEGANLWHLLVAGCPTTGRRPKGGVSGWLATNDRSSAVARSLTDCMLASIFWQFFHFFSFFFGVMRMGLAFWENGCTTPPFFEACPYTWEYEFFHSS